MKKIKSIFKLKNIVFFLIFSLVILFVLFRLFQNDGKNNVGIYNVYYRTYSNRKWSSWTKNGITSGNLKNSIEKVEIRVGRREKGEVIFRVYDKKKKWINKDNPKEKYDISAIKISLTKTLYKKYDIYYRTYNDDDKWMGWTTDGDINGNAKKNIKGIEIKIVPKNIILNEYLKDYDISTIDKKNFN